MSRRHFQTFVIAAATALLFLGCGKPQKPVSTVSPGFISAMNKGVSAMGQYQYEAGVEAFQQALREDPASEEARVNLAIALFNRNRKEDIESGQKLLDEVLAKAPENLRALYFKAILLQHTGKAEEAVTLLERVVKVRQKDGAAWYILGLCKQRLGRPAEAELLESIKLKPYLYSAYYVLYQALVRSGQEERATGYLEKFKVLRESPLGESIELPQYNQMGDLALVRPVPATRGSAALSSKYTAGKPVVLHSSGAFSNSVSVASAVAGDFNQDGLVDLVVPLGSPGPVVVLTQQKGGSFANTTAQSGLGSLRSVVCLAVGDVDNDGVPDLLATENGRNMVWQNDGKGTFQDISAKCGIQTGAGARSGLWLDADHDGDLDILTCTEKELWLSRNNADGTFTNAVVGLFPGATMAVPVDFDRDRDLDLVLLRPGSASVLLVNELLNNFTNSGVAMPQAETGVAQDFDGDGIPDLLAFNSASHTATLLLGRNGEFVPSAEFAERIKSAATWGEISGIRAADANLDGYPDVICFGRNSVVLLINDGQGHFSLQGPVLKADEGQQIQSVECLDLTGDFVPDLLVTETGSAMKLKLYRGELSLPLTVLAVLPTGVRSRDGRTRSPAIPFGLFATARAGLREQTALMTGQSGGLGQSAVPMGIGLGGASKADYLALRWPDGVSQVEVELPAGHLHKISELERKISSCPVLFTWNGTRFGFVTDFAGVGGLGYYSAPGVYASPQRVEHILIRSDQLQPLDGALEMRVAEPMEEVAYIDHVELVAVDHPPDQPVFPDERLAISGSAPTHQTLLCERPLFPISAHGPDGADCAKKLLAIDREYGFLPKLDRRFVGFCEPHSLELDFGDRLSRIASKDRMFLFVNASLEYPYSQTIYAAAQAGVSWQPIRVEAWAPDVGWVTVVQDAGAPGGMARTMTVDLTGLLPQNSSKLRLVSNMELFYDQVFVSRVSAPAPSSVHSVPLKSSNLRRAGFAREVSPDGRLPLIYDYDQMDASAPFKSLRGHYTAFGSVDELLAEDDDEFVVFGPGEEIALQFDASRLPPLQAGSVRDFIFISTAYCKDMDLYTGTPVTVDPLPYKAMPKYPHTVGVAKHSRLMKKFNTRQVN